MKSQDFASKSPNTTNLGPGPLKSELGLTTRNHLRNQMSNSNAENHSPFRVALSFASLGLVCFSLIACQPQKGSDVPKTGPGGQTAGAPAVAGTGDSSGGNGLQGKVFERYAVDITKTQAWISHIAPIEAHFQVTPHGENSDFKDVFTILATTRRWYIAPVALNQIPKDKLGVNVFQDPIQQLALQTLNREVWIDQSKFDDQKVSDLDRAYLFMHEKMVGLYLVRFLSFSDVVRLFSKTPEEAADPGFVALLEEKYKPEPLRSLTPKDYAYIRAMTDFMMKDAVKISDHGEIEMALYRNQFDPRFFGPHAASKKSWEESESENSAMRPRTKSVSTLNLLNRLEATSVVSYWPSTCRLDDGSIAKAANCQVGLEMKRSEERGISVKLTFETSGPTGGQTVVFHRIFPNSMLTGTDVSATQSTVVELKRPLSGGEGVVQFYGMGAPVNSSTNRQELKVGGKAYDLWIVWDQNVTRVLDFILVDTTVTKIHETRPLEFNPAAQAGDTVGFAWIATPDESRRDLIVTSDNKPMQKVRNRAYSGNHNDRHWLDLNIVLTPDFK
jgi:hypothetical protein